MSAEGQQSGQRVEDAIGVGGRHLPSSIVLLVIEKILEAGREKPSSLPVDVLDDHGNPSRVIDGAG